MRTQIKLTVGTNILNLFIALLRSTGILYYMMQSHIDQASTAGFISHFMTKLLLKSIENSCIYLEFTDDLLTFIIRVITMHYLESITEISEAIILWLILQCAVQHLQSTIIMQIEEHMCNTYCLPKTEMIHCTKDHWLSVHCNIHTYVMEHNSHGSVTESNNNDMRRCSFC